MQPTNIVDQAGNLRASTGEADPREDEACVAQRAANLLTRYAREADANLLNLLRISLVVLNLHFLFLSSTPRYFQSAANETPGAHPRSEG